MSNKRLPTTHREGNFTSSCCARQPPAHLPVMSLLCTRRLVTSFSSAVQSNQALLSRRRFVRSVLQGSARRKPGEGSANQPPRFGQLGQEWLDCVAQGTRTFQPPPPFAVRWALVSDSGLDADRADQRRGGAFPTTGQGQQITRYLRRQFRVRSLETDLRLLFSAFGVNILTVHQVPFSLPRAFDNDVIGAPR